MEGISAGYSVLLARVHNNSDMRLGSYQGFSCIHPFVFTTDNSSDGLIFNDTY